MQIYRISLSPAAVPIERYISYFIHYLPLPPPGGDHSTHLMVPSRHGPRLLLSHELPSSSWVSSSPCAALTLSCLCMVVSGVHAIHLRLDLGLHDPIVDLPTSLEPIEFRLPGTQPTHATQSV